MTIPALDAIHGGDENACVELARLWGFALGSQEVEEQHSDAIARVKEHLETCRDCIAVSVMGA